MEDSGPYSAVHDRGAAVAAVGGEGVFLVVEVGVDGMEAAEVEMEVVEVEM